MLDKPFGLIVVFRTDAAGTPDQTEPVGKTSTNNLVVVVRKCAKILANQLSFDI